MKSGVLKSVSNNTLHFTDNNGDDQSVSVVNNVSVTLNGKSSKLADLKAGDAIQVSGDPATSVSATR